MVPRIQHGAVLRLAQLQGSRSGLKNRPSFLRPSIRGAQHRPLQPFSTCSVRQQDPRQPPVSSTEPTELPAPTPAASEPTQPEQSTAVPPIPPPPPPPKKQKPASRLAPRLILAITCALLGAALGSSTRLLLAPPVPIEPGSDEDAYTTRVLHEQAAKLPIVRALTAASSPPSPSLSSSNPQPNPPTDATAEPEPEYEYDTWDAYTSLSPSHRAQHISAGALSGSRGVGGFQRVWRHRRSGELLSVIYFGSSTTGWPGVVHGGCLATILDESCGRAAFQEWGGRAGVTASLGLEYKKVTLANGFYVVRVRVRPEEELPEGERGKRHYKCWVDATVEDPVSGQVNVAAQALFVGGRGKKGRGGNGEVKGGWRIVGGGAEGGESEEGLLKGNAKDAHIRF